MDGFQGTSMAASWTMGSPAFVSGDGMNLRYSF